MKKNFFNDEYARDYGVEEAIIIEFLKFHIEVRYKNKKFSRDEKHWTFGSAKSISDNYLYLNESKVKRLINSLKKQGVIITENFNAMGYDRTLWYAFVDEDKFLDQKIVEKYSKEC